MVKSNLIHVLIPARIIAVEFFGFSCDAQNAHLGSTLTGSSILSTRLKLATQKFSEDAVLVPVCKA